MSVSTDSYRRPFIVAAIIDGEYAQNSLPDNVLDIDDANAIFLGNDATTVSHYGRSMVGLIEDFSYSFSGGGMWIGSFSFFDPSFNDLLALVNTAAFARTSVRVVFQFGWIGAGGVRESSPVFVGAVTTSPAPSIEYLLEGCRVTFHVLPINSRSLTIDRPLDESRVYPPGKFTASEIVRDLLENPPLFRQPQSGGDSSEANARQNEGVYRNLSMSRKIIVDTPIETLPVYNNGQPIIVANTHVRGFVESLIQDGLAVPKDRKHRARPMQLIIVPTNKDTERYIFTAGGLTEDPNDTAVLREYLVGRVRDSAVLDFRPESSSDFFNMLAGAGSDKGVSRDGKIMQKTLPTIVATKKDHGDLSSKGLDGPPIYSGISFSRDIESMVTRRIAKWSAANLLALTAFIRVVGDPAIKMLSRIRVVTYQGGTLSLSGIDSDNTPKVFPPLSGEYIVTGFTHNIRSGTYITSMNLIVAPEKNAHTSASSDPVTDENTVQIQEASHLLTQELQPVRGAGRSSTPTFPQSTIPGKVLPRLVPLPTGGIVNKRNLSTEGLPFKPSF